MTVEILAFEFQGPRDHMEDRHKLVNHQDGVFCALLDGHGGDQVAQHAVEAMPSYFLSHGGDPEVVMDRMFRQVHHSAPHHGGAVALSFFLQGDVLTTANAGDSHLLMVNPIAGATRVTKDHRVDDPFERARVIKAGAWIQGPYVMNGMRGGIMPTRSLGDHEMQKVGITEVPATSTTAFRVGYLVAATDGLWDYVKEDFVASCCYGTANDIMERLVPVAQKATRDNLTIIVVSKT